MTASGAVFCGGKGWEMGDLTPIDTAHFVDNIVI